MTSNRPRVSVAEIQRTIAQRYGFHPRIMKSPCRLKRLARTRQLAMYFARELTPLSFPTLGRLFGKRDHTTILYGWRRVRERAERHTMLALELDAIERALLDRAASH